MYGLIIKKLRKENKLTQKELSLKLGFESSSALAMIERGERNASIDTLGKLSKIFNVSIDYLLGKTSESHPGEIDQLEKDFKVFFSKMGKISQSDRDKILKMIEMSEEEKHD